ncbi:MAG: hypothetical protein RL736_64 [Pseudomonadota bacterium]|jgi:hypothetical protein
MNKWLYEFDAKNVIKKDDGSQETVIKKFALLKPNRRLREDGELFYATETSRFAKAGVLPKAAWGTILSNGGGSISDQEREQYGSLLLKFRDLSFELQSILIKGEGERTVAEKTRSNDLINDLDDIRREIQNFESSQIAIFENTAEAKARNRTILWWVMNLAYKKNEDDYQTLFEGSTFEEKLIQYDSFEDNENKYEFLLGVIRRVTYLITLWFLGRIDTKEDFEMFDKNFLKENKIDVEETKIISEESSLIEEIKP